MQRNLKLLAAVCFAAVAVCFVLYRYLPGRFNRAPTYDWQCAQCQYRFRQSVPNAAADVPIINCPKCKTKSAEREMHFQCRKCWNRYNLRGSQASLSNLICPRCGSRAARDLDHPIPGDDEPVEGGQPYPGK